MDNKVLDEIKEFAVRKLNATYGYCGCAEASNFAMLNSTDKTGKDVKITITHSTSSNEASD